MSKIVVGVDLSAHSELAAAHAIDLARSDGSELVLVLADFVVEVPEALATGMQLAADTFTSTLTERLATDRRDLRSLRERWAGRGVVVSERIVDGYPDEQLPRVAAELGAELIVVGSHGRTGWKRLLLGSVAERVIRLADCAVLVARGEAPIGGYRHLVVGTDFSAAAGRAVDRAIAMVGLRGRIDLVHCWQMSPLIAPPDAPAVIPTYERIRIDMIEQFSRDGDAMVARARAAAQAETDVRFHLLERPAAHGLDDFARDVHADLIVVGSHGRRGMRRFLLGSVAEVTVRHAPCAVLVVR